MALLLALLTVFSVLSPIPFNQSIARGQTVLTFTVDSTADLPDLVDDGLCVANDGTTTGTDVCTLRAAIHESSLAAGPVTIGFSVSGTISPQTAFVNIEKNVAIDGTGQNVVIDGSGVVGGNQVGFFLEAGANGSTLKNLTIQGFSGAGIYSDASNTTVESNFITGNGGYGIWLRPGAADNLVNGNAIESNGLVGLFIQGPGNDVVDNVISGNIGAGVRIAGNDADENTVRANYIGTNSDATEENGNSQQGIVVQTGADETTIGGFGLGDANYVSGNDGAGIVINDSENAYVLFNFVGEGSTGADLGNGGPGIQIGNGGSHTIEGNTVAFNGSDPAGTYKDGITLLNSSFNQISGNYISANVAAGVAIPTISGGPGTDNAISGNSVENNGGLGIDLGSVGVTANDSGDADTGPNDLQNFPVIDSAIVRQDGDYADITVSGTLESEVGQYYQIEFFSSDTCDDSGYGEGSEVIGSGVFEIPAGDTSVDFEYTAEGYSFGEFVTATATQAFGEGATSEFSLCVAVSTDTDLVPGGLILSQDSAVSPPNSSVTLTATVATEPGEGQEGGEPVGGITVNFEYDDGTETFFELDSVVTDAEGRATLVVEGPEDEGEWTFFASISEPDVYEFESSVGHIWGVMAPTVTIGGFGPDWTGDAWGIGESYLTDTVGYLLDPANFGPDGTVNVTFEVVTVDAVSADALVSSLQEIDVFFTGWVDTASYNLVSTEGPPRSVKQILRDWVDNGGALIATTDDTSHTMVDAFGLIQLDGTGSPTTNTITNTTHPIADGPFGQVAAYQQWLNTGAYDEPLPSSATEIGRQDLFEIDLGLVRRRWRSQHRDV